MEGVQQDAPINSHAGESIFVRASNALDHGRKEWGLPVVSAMILAETAIVTPGRTA
jgi:hypothetical protein